MEQRTEAIAQTMNDIRAIEAEHGPTRTGVAKIRDRLLQLAAQRELFSLHDFPPPTVEDGARGCLYRLAQDSDDCFALYANSSRGDMSTPAHNHTTWAVVVGFEGSELNRFYRRSADGGVEQTGEHLVEEGTGVAMVGDDLHSIHIDGPALNFHCYGLALERLDQRQYYHAGSNQWRLFDTTIGIREARSEFTSY